jgi:hypothetical protein
MVHDDDPVERTDTCETCRFFEAQRVCGLCHRYPPRAGNGLDADRYPRVEETNFCGEHQAAYGHGV